MDGGEGKESGVSSAEKYMSWLQMEVVGLDMEKLGGIMSKVDVEEKEEKQYFEQSEEKDIWEYEVNENDQVIHEFIDEVVDQDWTLAEIIQGVYDALGTEGCGLVTDIKQLRKASNCRYADNSKVSGLSTGKRRISDLFVRALQCPEDLWYLRNLFGYMIEVWDREVFVIVSQFVASYMLALEDGKGSVTELVDAVVFIWPNIVETVQNCILDWDPDDEACTHENSLIGCICLFPFADIVPTRVSDLVSSCEYPPSVDETIIELLQMKALWRYDKIDSTYFEHIICGSWMDLISGIRAIPSVVRLELLLSSIHKVSFLKSHTADDFAKLERKITVLSFRNGILYNLILRQNIVSRKCWEIAQRSNAISMGS